jgi:periplasmic protein TonB
MQGGSKRPDLGSEPKRDAGGDLGAVVPLRAQTHTAATSSESDLSNVIPFARRGRKPALTNAPAIDVAAGDRPAPQIYSADRHRRIAVLVGGSLLIHGALFAAFNSEPEPHASIGMISITAEIVLGAQTNAGSATIPTESEGMESSYSPESKAPAGAEPELTREDVAKKPLEEPNAVALEQATASKAAEPLLGEKLPEPRTDIEPVSEQKPVEKRSLTLDQKKPDAKEARKIREAARQAKDDSERKRDRAAPFASPSASSNSVGRGRSDLNSNYAGILAAHLARYKQMPSDAPRGVQGVATVSFSLNSSGSVTSVRLVRGSGVPSFDQEATAMVRRASPFPPPPLGYSNNTVPIGFQAR